MTDTVFLARDFALHPPRFLLGLALGSLAALLFCWPTWPGFMSYDSMFAYKQSLTGVETAVWPPMHVYMFILSRKLGAGVGGLFAAQAVILFSAAALILSLFVRRAWMVVAAFLLFAGLFVWFAPLWGTLGVLWKDVTTASFALLGVAFWLVAIRRVSYAWLAAAAVSLFLSIALRYNAAPLTFFVMVLMTALPFGPVRRRFARRITAGLLLGAVTLAFLSMRYRLPDLHALPPATGFAATQEFDLIGMSVCLQEDLLPPGMSNFVPIDVAQIAKLYDPRHVQLAFRDEPGLPRLLETDADGAVEQAWLHQVPRHVGCYLRHRLAVFREQMGAAGATVFYPTHGALDANPYGIHLARPKTAAQWTQYILHASSSWFRRAFILYAVAALLVAMAMWHRAPGRLVMGALLLGAVAYPATLFFVGPAADARYVFPSSVTCALLIALALAALSRHWTGAPDP